MTMILHKALCCFPKKNFHSKNLLLFSFPNGTTSTTFSKPSLFVSRQSLSSANHTRVNENVFRNIHSLMTNELWFPCLPVRTTASATDINRPIYNKYPNTIWHPSANRCLYPLSPKCRWPVQRKRSKLL